MKKILILFAALTISLSAFSQSYNNAIGVRLGYNADLSFKTFVTNSNFLEVDLFFRPWQSSALGVNAYYAWNFNINGGLSWYVGPGLSGMFYDSHAYLGIKGLIGLEYKFANAPIAISLDYAPGIRLFNGATVGDFYTGGLGVKFTF